MTIRFTIGGPPRGQGRPRFTRSGRAYTHKDDIAWHSNVADYWNRSGEKPLVDVPYAVELFVRMKRPQSHFKKSGGLTAKHSLIWSPGKPDLDNMVKGVLDALVGASAIPDDRLMIYLLATKRWDKEDGIDVTIREARHPSGGAHQDAHEGVDVRGRGGAIADEAGSDPLQLIGGPPIR